MQGPVCRLMTAVNLSIPFMNILIENAETLEYLAANGKWTKKPADGTVFPATRAAVAAAKNEPIGKFNIVVIFPPRTSSSTWTTAAARAPVRSGQFPRRNYPPG